MFLPLVQARAEVVKPAFQERIDGEGLHGLCLDVIRRHKDAILTWYAAIKSLLDDLQTVAVGITSKKSLGETEIGVGNSGNAGRNGASAAAIEFSECLFGIGSPDRRLPMPDIIGARVFWRRAAISR